MAKMERDAAVSYAIDFGTSNSAIARAFAVAGSSASRVEIAALEGNAVSIPTAVFYSAEDGSRQFGRAAVAAYVDGHDGRLMRSIKSILGSDLMDEATELAGGIQLKYSDVVIAYLRHIKATAEAQWQQPIDHAVMGRPVFFVDDDPRRDAQAEQTLGRCAQAAGIVQLEFEFEPIAAALDYEARLTSADGERRVLVADIGGGTSDFSLVRTSAAAHGRADRRDDILANHGLHVAGTDFDRAVNLAKIMPVLGFNGAGPSRRPVPSKIYFDLATWHLINTTYAPSRIAELRRMRTMYLDHAAHRRLLHVLTHHRGHELAAKAEEAKIAVSEQGATVIDLHAIEAGCQVRFDAQEQAEVLSDAVDRIVQTARDTVRMAQLKADTIECVYFTGGSTGLEFLVQRLGAVFPRATLVRGDRQTSVVSGLARASQRRRV